jgi:hypothetical protein
MRIKLVVASVATAATVSAVGASAYTASITNVDASKVIGYGVTTITGAAFDSQPTFTYSALHDKITGIDVVLTGDTSASALSFIRNTDAPVTCNTAGTVANAKTTYHCTGLTMDIIGMTSLGFSLL